MRPILLLAPLLAASSLAGCRGDAPQQFLVPDVRILAIQDRVGTTAFADADRADVLHVTALVANPLGRDPATITVSWYTCAPILAPPLSPCLDVQQVADPATFPAAPGVVALGAGTSITVDLATLSFPAYPYSVGPILDAVFAAANANPALRCDPYVDLPVVAIARAPGVAEVAVKRVRLTPTSLISATTWNDVYKLNLNPAVAGLTMNPSDPAACASAPALAAPLPPGTVKICAIATAESIQQYARCEPGGAVAQVFEPLDWQWYVSGGVLKDADFNGNVTGNPVDLTPPAGAFTLWTIVRDGRGGAGWDVVSF